MLTIIKNQYNTSITRILYIHHMYMTRMQYVQLMQIPANPRNKGERHEIKKPNLQRGR